MELTKENFERFANTIIAGADEANKYSRDCFGSSDLKLAFTTIRMVDCLLNEVRNAGYDPFSLVKPILEKYNYQYYPEQELSLKQELDDDFEIETELNNSYAYGYCQNVYSDLLTKDLGEMVSLNTYKEEIKVNRRWLNAFVIGEYGMMLDEFLNTYIYDDAERIKDIYDTRVI